MGDGNAIAGPDNSTTFQGQVDPASGCPTSGRCCQKGILQTNSLAIPETCLNPKLHLQLPSQGLHHLANRLLIPPIPAPLTFLRRLHQACFRQNRHVMRDRRLRQLHPLLDVPRAQATASIRGLGPALHVFLQGLQNSPPRRVGNRMQDAIEILICIGHRCTRNNA
jgi:hypothetical protein